MSIKSCQIVRFGEINGFGDAIASMQANSLINVNSMNEDDIREFNTNQQKNLQNLSDTYSLLYSKYTALVSYTEEERDRVVTKIILDLKAMGNVAGFERAIRMYNTEFFEEQEDREFAIHLANSLLDLYKRPYRVWEIVKDQ